MFLYLPICSTLTILIMVTNNDFSYIISYEWNVINITAPTANGMGSFHHEMYWTFKCEWHDVLKLTLPSCCEQGTVGGKGKVKVNTMIIHGVNLSLCTPWRGCCATAPHILKLGTRLRWGASFGPQPTWEELLPIEQRAGWTPSWSGPFGEEKNLLPSQEFNFDSWVVKPVA